MAPGSRALALAHSPPLGGCVISGTLFTFSQPQSISGDNASTVNSLGGLETSAKYAHGVLNTSQLSLVNFLKILYLHLSPRNS